MFIYPKMYRKLKRGPQVILPKDIGIIVAYSGICKESVCIDAGTGSGWLAVSLARICKDVYSYDTREEFTRIAQKNKEIAGVDNLSLKTGDVTKHIKEKNADLFTLDLPDAEKALATVKKSLKQDGVVAAYLPHTEQLSRFVSKLEKLGFYDVYTVEVIVRDILVRKEGVRPSTKGIWHTAYLAFGRKGGNYGDTALKTE
jgi:tRNA (adenine57-N1/adenine58-N1)-methyltransferase